MLLAKVFEDVQLAISSGKVQSRVPKLVLMIDLVVFLLTEKVDHFKAASLRSCEQRSFTELVLDPGPQAPLHQVIATHLQ